MFNFLSRKLSALACVCLFCALTLPDGAASQSSSSITVNGVVIEVVGGSSQSISTTSNGAEIELDGRLIVIDGNTISVDGSSISGDSFDKVTIDASGNSLKVIVDGQVRMELSSGTGGDQDEGGRLTDLGFAYYVGEDVEQSYDKAIELFEQAALEYGNGTSANNLAIIYWNGREGVAVNRAKALEYAPIAAEQGFPASMFYLGSAQLEGELVPQNIESALSYLNQAADKDFTDAMLKLADLYRDGEFVEKDDVRANEGYRRAADLGNNLAALRYAIAAWDAMGMEKNAVEALKYAEQAEQGSYLVAFYLLGLIYDHGGDGVSVDDERAVAYYLKGAEYDHAASAFNLAFMYKQGEGTEQSLEQAIFWMRRADELGYERAEEQLKLFEAAAPSNTPPPPPEPPIYWYLSGQERVGPMRLSELKQALSDGRITQRSYVWKEGLEDWVFANALPELLRE